MNYYAQSSAHQVMAHRERRSSSRKPLKRRVNIGACGTVINGLTLDISDGGLSVVVDRRLNTGSSCELYFNIAVDGVTRQVSGSGTISHCVCAGLDGFRIGLEFIPADETSRQTVLDYLAVCSTSAQRV